MARSPRRRSSSAASGSSSAPTSTRPSASPPGPGTGPSAGSAGGGCAMPGQARAALVRADHDPIEPVGPVSDDRLRLIFTCCHPALAPTAQIALTLRLLGGLQTPEIARAFLVQEATMAARITRAKKKIAAAKIPYRVPGDAELPDQLLPVLAVLYLVFNEGYTASAGDELTRPDLSGEAIR